MAGRERNIIRVGELKWLVEIYTRAIVQNTDYGGKTESFTLLGTSWAKKKHIRAAENVEADKNTVFNRVAWTIRHRTDFDETSQIRYDGKIYNIGS